MIGIIGAMEEEVSQLIEAMEEKEKVTCAGMDFYCGKLKDKEVVIVQSGIGKVNMALCTQILADRFDVKAVINTGVAGGLYKDIEIGDIVISKDAVQHDVDATVFGYKVGEIPRMDTSYFEADKDLIELAKKTCDEVNPDIHSYVGRVVSGDQFISDNKKKHYLINEFDGYCAEIHEAPVASPRGEAPLPAGSIVTAEPGIYLPGKFGVRIEDMLYVIEDGCIDLTDASKQLIVL